MAPPAGTSLLSLSSSRFIAWMVLALINTFPTKKNFRLLISLKAAAYSQIKLNDLAMSKLRRGGDPNFSANFKPYSKC
jgi:hypothetical protein